MTTRAPVINRHIEDDLILVFKKQTPTVKVITVRLRFSYSKVAIQIDTCSQGYMFVRRRLAFGVQKKKGFFLRQYDNESPLSSQKKKRA